MNYEAVIGLEVHAELSTKTKIFCGCSTAFGAEINTHVCPVCTGQPGALPVLNKQVVHYAAKMGLATHCTVNQLCKSDRKNYFYPDLPKAYQISQFDVPICENGYVDFEVNGEPKRVRFERIHFEEDAGKLLHDEGEGTVVDFNRCGVPLIEIVSEPDMRSSAEAKAYLDTIKATLQYLGISDCKMQEGSIRCDVNVSVRPEGSTEFGTRVEMKNVNSFSATVRAIEYEAARQIEILENGGEIHQETRRWDDIAGKNILLRSKEDAQDYRYFPEPDLKTVYVEESRLAELKASIPELPNDKLLRLMKQYKLPYFDANLMSENPDKADYFEAAAALGSCQPKNISNWLLGDITRIINEKNLTLADTSLSAEKLAEMLAMIEKGEISTTAGKTVLEEIIFSDKTAADVVEEKGLRQMNDTAALEQVVRDILAANPKVVEDYRGGKTNALGFLVGQCMRASKGKGNPNIMREMLEKALNG